MSTKKHNHIEMTDEEFEEKLKMVIERSTRHPDRMNASLKLQLLESSADGMEGLGEAVFGYTVNTAHLNPYGGIHGGIVAALLDTCMGTAIAARTDHFVITTDLSVSFLRALTDSHFRIYIAFTHLGRRMASVTGKIVNADRDDEICATGMGTFMLLNTEGESGVQV